MNVGTIIKYLRCDLCSGEVRLMMPTGKLPKGWQTLHIITHNDSSSFVCCPECAEAMTEAIAHLKRTPTE